MMGNGAGLQHPAGDVVRPRSLAEFATAERRSCKGGLDLPRDSDQSRVARSPMVLKWVYGYLGSLVNCKGSF